MRFLLSNMYAALGLMAVLSAPAAFAFDFSSWDGLLKKYVAPKTMNGVKLQAVDYKKLGKDQAYTKLIKDLKKTSLSDLTTRKEKLTFWINVYKIMAAKMVLDHYPVESINELHFGGSWEWLSNVINTLGKTGMAVGATCALILDNTIPGTREERGLHAWQATDS